MPTAARPAQAHSKQDSGLPFWLMLYAGLIVFNIFAETVSRAPGAVRGYPNFW